jgi:hypothetical protein
MRFLKMLLIFSMLANIQFAFANERCKSCAKLDNLTAKLAGNEAGSLQQARHQIETFEFSKARGLRRLEISSFVKLGAVAIAKDPSGDSDSYFYNAYLEDKPRFDQAIAELPEYERALIRKSLKDTAATMRNGNG